MKSRSWWALSLVALIGGPGLEAKPVDGTSSRIAFVASQSDVPVEGRFRQFAADVDFDPAKPEQGKVRIVIELASVDTGSADADEMLRGRGFFDAAHFPQASFTSTSIRAEGGGKYRATGQFTLKGRSLVLAVPFTESADGGGLRFEGSVPVSRLAYKVGEGEWTDTGTLADQVLVKFSLYQAR